MMIRLLPQISVFFIGIICFISGAFIKNTKILLAIVIIAALLIGFCFALMIVNYADWIETILHYPSHQTIA
jgi:hypothetical protein